MQMQLPQIYYILFTAVTAAGVLLQALVLLGMYFAIRESARKLHQVIEEFREHALPTIATTRKLIEDISPKLKIASSNLVEASHTLRHQAAHVDQTVDDVLNKTTAQAARINEMVTGVLDSVIHAANAVQTAVIVPSRKIASLYAGLKAGFDVLLKKEREPAVVEPVVDPMAEPFMEARTVIVRGVGGDFE